jgi:hypothetical protein
VIAALIFLTIALYCVPLFSFSAHHVAARLFGANSGGLRNVSTVYMGLVVAEWHCRMVFLRQRYSSPNGPHSEAATRKPAVAPESRSSSMTTMRKRAASLSAAIDSGFDGEPQVSVDHSASGPDAVDFMAIANGGGAAYVAGTYPLPSTEN